MPVFHQVFRGSSGLPPDEGEGEPIVLVHGFGSSKEVTLVQPELAHHAPGRRPPGDRTRQPGRRPIDQALRPLPSITPRKWPKTCARCSITSGMPRADVMGSSMGARIAAFPRSRIRTWFVRWCRAASVCHLTDGGGAAREHRRGAGGALACRRCRSAGPFVSAPLPTTPGPTAGRSPPASAARGRCRPANRARPIRTTTLIAVGTKDPIAGSGEELAAVMPKHQVPPILDRDSLRLGVRRRGVKWRRREAAVSSGELMTRPVTPAAAMFSGRVRQQCWRRRPWRGGAAEAAAARRRPDPRHAWKKTRRSDRPHGRRRLCRRSARARRFRMGPTAISVHRLAADARVLGRHPGRAWRRAAGGGRRLAWRDGGATGQQPAVRSQGKAQHFSALVLVDITPRVDVEGVSKIQGFMRAQLRDGFGSIAEAADAVAAYLPHRPRPRSHEGAEEEPAAASRRRWRWHSGPALPRRQPPNWRGSQRAERALVSAAKRHHPGPA